MTFFLGILLFSCIVKSSEFAVPPAMLNDPVSVCPIMDTHEVLYADTGLLQSDIGSCEVDGSLDVSEDTKIVGYNTRVEGCISPYSVDMFAAFYGYDENGDAVCGEAVRVEAAPGIPVQPCYDCQFSHNVFYSQALAGLLEPCSDLSVSGWWEAVGYNSTYDVLHVYDGPSGWQSFFVDESSEEFDDESFRFSYSLN